MSMGLQASAVSRELPHHSGPARSLPVASQAALFKHHDSVLWEGMMPSAALLWSQECHAGALLCGLMWTYWLAELVSV